MNRRTLLRAGGVLAFGLGALGLVAPGALGLDFDEIVVSAIGGLALLYAYHVVQRRRRTDLQWAGTGDPELPIETAAPGEEFDDVLSAFTDISNVFTRHRLKDGLRAAAIAVLTRYGSLPEPEARDRLDEGTWTGDRVAAAFLGGEDAPESPLTSRLRHRMSGRRTYERAVEQTVDAIAAIAGLPSDPDDSSSRARGLRRWLPGSDYASRAGSDSASRRRNGTGESRNRSRGSGRRAPGPARGDGGARHSRGDPRQSRDARSEITRATNHWNGVSVVALVGIGLGVLVEQPGVLLAGVVGIGYAAYAYSTRGPSVELSVERSLDEVRPVPGAEIEVTVTVENEGSRLLPDLRLVDGVPDGLGVVDGSPRLGTTLRPGESDTISYTVLARRGVHEFEPLLALARDPSGGTERELQLEAETALVCSPTMNPLPEVTDLREQASRRVGRVDVSAGGEGVEFFATREYRRGDPLNRIDWNRRARTGELATLQFRNQRATTVILVVDAREAAYRSPEPGADHAVDRSVEAAGSLFTTLLEAGDRVGLAAYAWTECWLEPDAGVHNHEHVERARELLTGHPALDPSPPDSPINSLLIWKRLQRRLPSGAQVIFLSPLTDPTASTVPRRLEAYGYPVTVVSPDPTNDRTSSERLAQVARQVQITDLRSAGIPVLDWPGEESLATVLARHEERRRR